MPEHVPALQEETMTSTAPFKNMMTLERKKSKSLCSPVHVDGLGVLLDEPRETFASYTTAAARLCGWSVETRAHSQLVCKWDKEMILG